MLFARAMSNGCKWYTPDVFNGPVYVPEEMQAVTVEDAVAEVVNPDVQDALRVLADVTDIAELKGWKAVFSAVIDVPEVKAAAKEKFTQLNHEAK
jgi:hypothetical protein